MTLIISISAYESVESGFQLIIMMRPLCSEHILFVMMSFRRVSHITSYDIESNYSSDTSTMMDVRFYDAKKKL